jgi:adenosine deaminase
MVEAVVAHPRDEVIGIGMDYLEVGHPPEKFWKAYRLAGQHGLKRTTHAGEFGEPARNIETALDLLECDRIDHGYTVFEIDDLLKRCRDEQIVFTIVPTNSYYNRNLRGQDFAQHHPIRHMADAGLKIMPNSDDPPLHHTDPANAYAEMVTTFGLPFDRLREFVLNGIDGAWVDEALRADWRRDWMATFDELAPSVAGVT